MDSISRTHAFASRTRGGPPGVAGLHQPQKAIPDILSGQAINAALADGAIQCPAPVAVHPCRALPQTLVRRAFVGLIAVDEGADRAVVDEPLVALWVAQPRQHFGRQDLTPMLKLQPASDGA